MRQQLRVCSKIFQLLQAGGLILDEVDLILHPLKSELNWPLGKKEALDFTSSLSPFQFKLKQYGGKGGSSRGWGGGGGGAPGV